MNWLRRLLRQPEPRVIGPNEWAVRHGWPEKNPVHEYFWPECHLPLPHEHPAFEIWRDK